MNVILNRVHCDASALDRAKDYTEQWRRRLLESLELLRELDHVTFKVESLIANPDFKLSPCEVNVTRISKEPHAYVFMCTVNGVYLELESPIKEVKEDGFHRYVDGTLFSSAVGFRGTVCTVPRAMAYYLGMNP